MKTQKLLLWTIAIGGAILATKLVLAITDRNSGNPRTKNPAIAVPASIEPVSVRIDRIDGEDVLVVSIRGQDEKGCLAAFAKLKDHSRNVPVIVDGFRADFTERVLSDLKLERRVTDLYLSKARIDDAGFCQLTKISIRSLDLSFTDVTATKLESLCECATAIKSLNLTGLDITEKTVVQIKNLKSLRRLWLCNTRVTDEMVAHLVTHEGLQDLYLSDTLVTDKGLVALAKIATLKQLDVSRTMVTGAGVAQFKFLRPDVLLPNHEPRGVNLSSDSCTRYLSTILATR